MARKGEMVPFFAMAAVEFVNVGLSTLFKEAAAKGLSYFVLIPYTFAIGAAALLPFIFIFPRRGLPSILNWSILCRLVILALIGCASNICSYKGIEYTSPTIASAISSLIPAFTFVFAVAFRMENLQLRSWKSRAKVVGTIVSMSGAIIMILYKGPMILSAASQPSLLLLEHSQLEGSFTDWVIGGLLMVAVCVFMSLSLILQTQIVKLYPNEVTVAVIASLLTSIFAAIVGAVLEKNQSAWALKTDMALLTVLLTGFFGPALATAIHTWGLNIKGPVYVTIFKPFSVAIAAAMGVAFLHEALYLGNVIGATIILAGFYAVIWGKKEEDLSEVCASESYGVSAMSSDNRIPLLI